MKMQKSPWYKNPYWLGGIALGVVVIALVLFLALRGGGDKKPDTPDQPNIEEPTPAPAPEPGKKDRSFLVVAGGAIVLMAILYFIKLL